MQIGYLTYCGDTEPATVRRTEAGILIKGQVIDMKMVPISENLAIAPPLEEARYLVVCDDGTDEIVLWTNAFADRQWRWFGLPEGKTVVSFRRVALD